MKKTLGYQFGRYVLAPLTMLAVVLLLVWGIVSAVRGIVGA